MAIFLGDKNQMTVISIFWLIILAFFIFYIFRHDRKVRNSEEYQVAIKNKAKPRKKLLIKRWWAWLLIIFMLILSLAANSSEDDDSADSSTAKTEETHKQNNKHTTKKNKVSKPKVKKSRKQSSQKKKKQKMLRILNMWASHNNEYGIVEIDKDNNPVLILNDQTAALSKGKLEYITTQFGNKVSLQKEINKVKVGDPAVYDKDDTPIAVWNGSTLELTNK